MTCLYCGREMIPLGGGIIMGKKYVICEFAGTCPEECKHKYLHEPANCEERALCHNRLLHDEHGVKCEKYTYPTAWAYEQVCKLLHEKEAEIVRLRKELDIKILENCKGHSVLADLEAEIKELKEQISKFTLTIGYQSPLIMGP